MYFDSTALASLVQSKLTRRQQLRAHLTPSVILARASARAGRFGVPYEHIIYAWHSDKVCNNTCEYSHYEQDTGKHCRPCCGDWPKNRKIQNKKQARNIAASIDIRLTSNRRCSTARHSSSFSAIKSCGNTTPPVGTCKQTSSSPWSSMTQAHATHGLSFLLSDSSGDVSLLLQDNSEVGVVVVVVSVPVSSMVGSSSGTVPLHHLGFGDTPPFAVLVRDSSNNLVGLIGLPNSGTIVEVLQLVVAGTGSGATLVLRWCCAGAALRFGTVLTVVVVEGKDIESEL